MSAFAIFALLWFASGLAGSAILLLVQGGVDALTDQRGDSDDKMAWIFTLFGVVTLFIAFGWCLTRLMPPLMRLLIKRR